MKIATMGTGGIGGYLAVRLSFSGHKIATIARGKHLEAIKKNGLSLKNGEDIETVLEPNMVISMETMITIPEGKPGAGGYREHDILLITEEGNETFTGFPYGPENNVVSN